MPDASGNLKGSGWSRARADAWDRIFSNAASPQTTLPAFSWPEDAPDLMAALEASLSAVPTKSSPEVDAPPDCNGCGEDGHVIDDCPEHPGR